MQVLDGFDERFTRRLRAELDAVEVALPVRRVASPRRARRQYFWIARPLSIALAAAIALGLLAASVTRSPDPGRWIQPGVWMRALGVAPASPEPSRTTAPSPEPSDTSEPAQSPEPDASAPAQSPGSEPTERAASPDARDSPEIQPGDS